MDWSKEKHNHCLNIWSRMAPPEEACVSELALKTTACYSSRPKYTRRSVMMLARTIFYQPLLWFSNFGVSTVDSSSPPSGLFSKNAFCAFTFVGQTQSQHGQKFGQRVLLTNWKQIANILPEADFSSSFDSLIAIQFFKVKVTKAASLSLKWRELTVCRGCAELSHRTLSTTICISMFYGEMLSLEVTSTATK